MKLATLCSASLALTLLMPLTSVLAQDENGDMDQTRDRLQTQDRDMDQDQDRDRLHTQERAMDQDGYPISGYGMMSQQEREQFRERMRSMTPEQRQAYRLEHHERMRERAQAQGFDIEDLPPTAAGPQGGKMNKDGSGNMGSGGGSGAMGSGGGKK